MYGGNDDQVLIGRVSDDEWWEVVRGRLGVDCAGLRRAIESSDVWDQDLLDAVRAARTTARTGILSNAWAWQRRTLPDDLVDEVLLSCEIGCAKPDRRAFEIALERLGTRPHDTLFVDDDANHVAAAGSLGIIGHVHTDTPSTVAAIERFLDAG